MLNECLAAAAHYGLSAVQRPMIVSGPVWKLRSL